MKNRKEYLDLNLTFYNILIDCNKNFSHVKIGDGEIFAMRYWQGENADKHSYSKKLGDELKESLIFLSKGSNVFIADWFYSNPCKYPHDFDNKNFLDNFLKENNLEPSFIQPFELLMFGWENQKYNYLFKFYQKIKQSNRKKVYICNEKFNSLKNILNINEFLNIPLINAYSEIDNIYNETIKIIEDNSIILMSVGMMSPILTNRLLNYNENITILDIGSGLDPLVLNSKNRGDVQGSHNEALEYFKNI